MFGTLKKNTFFSAVTNLSDFLQFALMILAGRVLREEAFGVFNNAWSLSIVFLTFSDLGLNHLAIRDIARDKSLAPRYLGNILSWKVLLSLAAFLLLMFTSTVVRNDDPNLRALVCVLGAAMMLRFFTLTARCFLHGFEKFSVETVAVVTEQSVLMVCGFAVLLTGRSVAFLAYAFLLARFVGLLVTYVLLNRTVPVRFRVESAFILKHQLEAAPIGIVFGIMMVYLHMDTLILSSIATDRDVGLYNYAFKIYNGLFIIPSIACTVLLPRLSSTYKTDRHIFNRLTIYGILAMAFAGMLIGAVGIACSGRIVQLVFQKGANEAGLPLSILFGTAAVSFQVWLARVVLIATDRQKALMCFYVLGLGVRVACDLVLIRRYGITGAAVATLVSETFLFAGIWIYVLTTRSRR